MEGKVVNVYYICVFSMCLTYAFNNNVCYQIFLLYHFKIIISYMIQVTELNWPRCYIASFSIDKPGEKGLVKFMVNASSVLRICKPC